VSALAMQTPCLSTARMCQRFGSARRASSQTGVWSSGFRFRRAIDRVSGSLGPPADDVDRGGPERREPAPQRTTVRQAVAQCFHPGGGRVADSLAPHCACCLNGNALSLLVDACGHPGGQVFAK
jgi:hypothetical protein